MTSHNPILMAVTSLTLLNNFMHHNKHLYIKYIAQSKVYMNLQSHLTDDLSIISIFNTPPPFK